MINNVIGLRESYFRDVFLDLAENRNYDTFIRKLTGAFNRLSPYINQVDPPIINENDIDAINNVLEYIPGIDMSDFILSRIQDNNKQLNAMYGGLNPMVSTEEIIGEENYTFKPSYKETWDAAFRSYGLVEPIMRYIDSQEWVDDEGYDPIADPQLADMPGLKLEVS